MLKIAINGFGRIGRNVLRAFYENLYYAGKIKIVAVNDLSPLEHAVHLLKYDSVHSRFQNKVSITGNDRFTIDNFLEGDDTIQYFNKRDIKDLPWADLGIDIVLECTGLYTKAESASQHLNSGAKHVIVSAPCDGADKTIVYGVNEDTLTLNDKIISNASCTTNCLAPLVALIHDNFGISQGFATTIHSYTGDQRLIDTDHSDLYRARAANLSMIPSKTGAAKAIGLIIPELNGKINGVAIRVPTPNVSLVDFTAVLETNTTTDELNALFKQATLNRKFKGVLAYNDEKLVSVDFNHDAHSSVFDSTQTFAQGNMIKVFSWYDNEWGFSNRMLDLSMYLANLK